MVRALPIIKFINMFSPQILCFIFNGWVLLPPCLRPFLRPPLRPVSDEPSIARRLAAATQPVSLQPPEPDLKSRPCSTSRASRSASHSSPLGLNNQGLSPQALGEARGEKRRRGKNRRKSVRSVARLSG